MDPDRLVDDVLAAVSDWSGGGMQYDDLTLVAVGRTPIGRNAIGRTPIGRDGEAGG